MERALSQCQHKFAFTNCKACGVYNHPLDPALKTVFYDSYLNCSADKYLKHMRRRQCSIVQAQELHEETYSLLLAICEKFEYGIQTLALGVYVYAKTYGKEEKQLSQQRFWASVSLIVASKAIELDRKVPYLNRYQRYSQQSYTQSQYQAAERKIFQLLNHDLQFTTFISFLNFYLTNGIVFKSDALYPGSLKYLEDDVMTKARDYMKKGEFLKFDAEKLALKIIKQVRGKYRLTGWAEGISKVSGLKDEIGDCYNERGRLEILRPLNNFSFKKLGSLNSSLSINLDLLNSTNSIEQKFKSCKKRSQPTTTSSSLALYKMQSMKQNCLKDYEKVSTSSGLSKDIQTVVPLGVLRNQLKSASTLNVSTNMSAHVNTSINRINGYYLGNSSERIVPLNTFSKRM